MQQFDWWGVRVRSLCRHTRAQNPKVEASKVSTYMQYFLALLVPFGAKSWASQQEFGHIENGNPNVFSQEAKDLCNKILKI